MAATPSSAWTPSHPPSTLGSRPPACVERRRRIQLLGDDPPLSMDIRNREDLVLLFSLVATGQIKLRRIDGWRDIAAVLMRATQTIPIVMISAGDPVGTGLVSSLSRPGGNVTGLSNLAEGLSAKWLELLAETRTR